MIMKISCGFSFYDPFKKKGIKRKKCIVCYKSYFMIIDCFDYMYFVCFFRNLFRSCGMMQQNTMKERCNLHMDVYTL